MAAGFPILLQANVEDDPGDGYEATVMWGDGFVEGNGEILTDDNNTPSDPSDDLSTIRGVLFSSDGLSQMGTSPLSAMHIYTSTGPREVTLCMRDSEWLESCDRTEPIAPHGSR